MKECSPLVLPLESYGWDLNTLSAPPCSASRHFPAEKLKLRRERRRKAGYSRAGTIPGCLSPISALCFLCHPVPQPHQLPSFHQHGCPGPHPPGGHLSHSQGPRDPGSSYRSFQTAQTLRGNECPAGDSFCCGRHCAETLQHNQQNRFWEEEVCSSSARTVLPLRLAICS